MCVCNRYVDLALRAFLPPCLENGVAFEAHGQNTLARFDRKSGELKGFVIRDFGGVKVHNETLKQSTGEELDILPDSCVEAHTLDEVSKLLYHTLFHCQFQRLIRVLDLHYNGAGWEIVRNKMSELIPKDHVMWPMFMGHEKVPGKCLVRMKIDELYRDVSSCFAASQKDDKLTHFIVHLSPCSQHDLVQASTSSSCLN